MKLLSIGVFVILLISCNKNDRKKGVCYCDFASGDKQEYDLSNSSRQDQKDKCSTHDKNAGAFGGECELE